MVLGAVIFLAIAIAVLGAAWLSENYAGAAGGYQLHVYFDSVPGLQPGDPVFIRGVWAGKVLEIRLTQGLPLVSIGFAEIRSLPRDSEVFLQSEGLLGGKMIDVRVGSDIERVYADHDTLQGRSGGGIEEMTDQAGAVAQRLEAVLADRNIAHIDALLANMDSTAVHLKQTLSENRETLAAVLDTAALAARDARGLLGENRADVRQVVGNLRRMTQRLDGVARDMETVLGIAGDVSVRSERGEREAAAWRRDAGPPHPGRVPVSGSAAYAGLRRQPHHRDQRGPETLSKRRCQSVLSGGPACGACSLQTCSGCYPVCAGG